MSPRWVHLVEWLKDRSRAARFTWRGWAFVRVIAVTLATSAAPTVARCDDGLLTLNLTVRMPDGSPAAGATVESLHQYPELDQNARTDESGNVAICEVFGAGARIFARSADGRFQATLKKVAPDARTTFANPLELTLALAIDHKVMVVAGGKPAADVQVVAAGHYFKVLEKTGPDGVAMLKLPADDQLNEVVAWHPQRGVAGIRDFNKGFARDSTNLSLLAPAPLTIRVVDRHGDPVPGLQLRMSMRTEESDDWISASDVNAAQVKTNADGEAVVPWAPRASLKYVDVDIIGTNWKLDETDFKQLSNRIVTVQVRRQKPVEGRLIMPAGASAEGILITGFGFGPRDTGCIPTIRARRDGTFRFDCPSEHGFVLGVFDREWASKPWTGLILDRDDDEEPAEIAIPVQRAIPLTVRVTRGADRIPAAGAWVDLEQRGEVHWIDAQGANQDGSGRVGGWLTTNSEGVADAGVARGKIHLNVQCGKWFEERALDVTTDDPIVVEFHRPWLGDRKVIARMTLGGTPYQPSSNLVVKAWTVRKGFAAPIHQPIIRDDHAIEVNFDDENLSLLVVDREKQRSGFIRLGPEIDSAELAMQPTASYSGTLLDENGDRLADRSLRLIAESSFLDVVEPQRTDRAGRFHFSGITVKAPLRLNVENEEGLPEYFLFGGGKRFEPGEVREGDELRSERQNATKKAEKPPRPLAERLADICENVRVAGMHALVVLEGDDSKNVIRLTDCVLDSDKDSILAYFPLTVSATQLQSGAATIDERQWPKPANGEIVLVALDGRQKLLGSETFTAEDVDGSASLADQFLTRHRPPAVDARAKLVHAREDAGREQRRVWVISSGPRCGPCFRLARWIDQHREVLEKDYVIVKAMGGLDKEANEINGEIGGAEHGIPWHVITEPDGTILVTSEGPLGNIGMPGSIEGIRHFRDMLEQTCRRMSSEEIDELIESLMPAK